MSHHDPDEFGAVLVDQPVGGHRLRSGMIQFEFAEGMDALKPEQLLRAVFHP